MSVDRARDFLFSLPKPSKLKLIFNGMKLLSNGEPLLDYFIQDVQLKRFQKLVKAD